VVVRSLILLVALGGLALACSLPGRSYPVSSPVRGSVLRAGEPVSVGRVRLQVRSHDNATLGRHIEYPVGAEGGFRFDPVELKVAGQEYGKRYFLLLYWLDGDQASTLWRADYSRMQLGGEIELSCELDRSPMKGPPCRFVGDARDQPWLLAAGARDFESLCASCHGAGARGDGPQAPTLPPPPADLTRIASRRGGVFPVDEIAERIDGREEADAHGTRAMPVWGERLAESYVPGGFTEARIRNRIDVLVDYLETLQQP
jgi:hypothetical protein